MTYNLDLELYSLLFKLDGAGIVVSLVQESRHISNVANDLGGREGGRERERERERERDVVED